MCVRTHIYIKNNKKKLSEKNTRLMISPCNPKITKMTYSILHVYICVQKHEHTYTHPCTLIQRGKLLSE